MTADGVITLVTLVVAFGALALTRLPPAAVLLAALSTLVLADVVDPATGFSGFSGTAPLTVAVLYVIAAGSRRTGLLAPLTGRLLGGSTERASLARMIFPVAAVSGFFNNTPLVAMLLPEVASWCRRTRRPVSAYLMPLSFATILGGTITLIGTSTNLVVSAALEQSGQEGFGFFELTKVGLPVAIVGLVVLLVVAPVLLPDRSDPADQAVSGLRTYALHLEVVAGGPLDHTSISAAGLRQLEGVFLADIVRDDRHLGPVGPDEVLEAGDLLVFVGDTGSVIDLRSRPGLQAPDDQDTVLAQATAPAYFEAVVGRGSALVGRTLKEVGGREGYRASAIAIHRAGSNLGGKLGEIELRAGDMLVLLAGRDLRDSRRALEDFLLIAPLDDAVPVVTKGARIVALAIAAFVVSASTGWLTTLEAAIVAAGIILTTRVLTFSEAKRAIDLDVVLMVAASLGLGAAVDRSGLAANIADAATSSLGFLGVVGVIGGIMLTTTLLTEIVTNTAAAAVVVPIAVRAAVAVDVDPRVMAVGVAVMASSSFLTPIGYQTNAMVYGPGGYRFTDFTRVGGLINLVVMLTTTTAVLVLG